MKVNLDALREQLEKEIQAIENKKGVLLDQVKHVEAVSRLAGRLDSQSVQVSAPEIEESAPQVDASPAESEDELEMDSELEPQLEQKVNGKAPENSSEEGFEWAFQGERA